MNWSEFWPHYLAEHSRPGTRAMHYAGTLLAVVFIGLSFVSPWFLLGALVTGYLFAWLGHFLIEHNRPATFRYPFKSFLSDWRMASLFLVGKIRQEYAKHGLNPRPDGS